MIIIRAQHISKYVLGCPVLGDVSLEVPEGSIFAVYGKIGAGKSTLLACLARLDSGHSGDVERTAGCTLALQRPALAPDLTLGENLTLFASLNRVPKRRLMSRVAHVLQDFALIPYRNVPASALSSGVLAKAEIARAFVSERKLVMIDGLFDLLDADSLELVWHLMLARRREEGTTFIIATSRGECAGRCDIAALMHSGRVFGYGPTSEMLKCLKPDVVVVESVRNPVIKSKIKERFSAVIEETEGYLKFTSTDGRKDVMELLGEHGPDLGAVYLRQSSMEDVLNHHVQAGGGYD